MDPRRRELLGKTRVDDADVRGEHEYPGETSPDDDALKEESVPAAERSHYAAGADGTQMVSEPEGAAPPEEDR